MVKILGLDPGLRKTGWGIIEKRQGKLHALAYGIVESDSTLSLDKRLNQIFSSLHQIIELYKPDEAAVEETFVNKNPTSTLKLGMARGVIMLVPSLFNLPVFEYSANKVKKTVVGVGHADKNQVDHMVKLLVSNAQDSHQDMSDALAIAICHMHYRTMHNLLKVSGE